jgi:hypothetical protein
MNLKEMSTFCVVSAHPIKRATFFGDTDTLGFTFYRFKGIYDLDLAKTNIQNGFVWKRVEKTLGNDKPSDYSKKTK